MASSGPPPPPPPPPNPPNGPNSGNGMGWINQNHGKTRVQKMKWTEQRDYDVGILAFEYELKSSDHALIASSFHEGPTAKAIMEKLAKLRKGQRTRLMNYGLWSGPTAPGTPSAAPNTPAAEATPAAGRPPAGSTPLGGFTPSDDTIQSFTHPAGDDRNDPQNEGEEGQSRKKGTLGPKRKMTQEESNADEEEARDGGHAGNGPQILKKMRSSDGSMPAGSMSNLRMGSGSTDGGVRLQTPYGLGRDGTGDMGGFGFRGGMSGGFESGGGGAGGADGLQGLSNRSVNTTNGAGRTTAAEVARLRVDVDRLTRELQAAHDRFRIAMGRRHQEGQE